MKIFSATYTDLIKFNRKPNEDFYLISPPIFVLADGVTQSRFESGGYAFPLGAKAAAEIFCYTVLDFLETNKGGGWVWSNPREAVEKSFDLANLRIRELNQNEGMTEKLDYLVYDYFDTVGIAGFILNDTLYYGYLGDCGLSILDKENKICFQTKDMTSPALEWAKKFYKGKWDEFSENKKNLILHKEFRNNPSGIGYGSFTGEEWVKRYYVIGNLPLNKGDLILVYSDGFLPYFKSKKFLDIVRRGNKNDLDKFSLKKAKENPRKFGTDRTLIAIQYENIENCSEKS